MVIVTHGWKSVFSLKNTLDVNTIRELMLFDFVAGSRRKHGKDMQMDQHETIIAKAIRLAGGHRQVALSLNINQPHAYVAECNHANLFLLLM